MNQSDSPADLLLQLKEKDLTVKKLQQELLFSELQLRLIHLVGEVPSKYEDIYLILDKILGTILEVLEVEAGSLLILDEAREILSFIVTRGEKAKEIKMFTLKMGEGIAGHVAKTGKPRLVSDVNQDPQWKSEIAQTVNFATRNILCVPLNIPEETIGVLQLINKKGNNPFTNFDLEVMVKLANEIALVIRNAQLVNESHNTITQLQTLIKITALINGNITQSNLLDQIMAAAEELMRAEASSIMLINKETAELEFQIARGEKSDEVKLITVPLGEGIAGRVAQSGESELVRDAINDPRIYKKVDEFSSFTTKSLICVPLKVKDNIIGVAQVLNKKGEDNYFTYKDLHLFESMANQAAIAIDNARLYEDLHNLLIGTIRSLVAAIDAKDQYTHGHSERITMHSLAIYNELEANYELDREELQISCLLHDVGKIGITENILVKPQMLTDDEYATIKEHAVIGANIMAPIETFSGDVLEGIRHHHERYDGLGYPDGLKGEEIPFIARIIAVADAFDAMTSDRPYRKGKSFDQAEEIVLKNAESQFDPIIVQAFKRARDKGYIYE